MSIFKGSGVALVTPFRKTRKGNIKMRKLRIVSDSSSDILELENVDFAYAPMKIITAEREFTDDSHLDVDEMANFFNMYKGRSQTSCPNVTDWIDALAMQRILSALQ